MCRSPFGARRPEQESFYIVTIACQVTERERNQICRRRRHSRKQQNNAQRDDFAIRAEHSCTKFD